MGWIFLPYIFTEIHKHVININPFKNPLIQSVHDKSVSQTMWCRSFIAVPCRSGHVPKRMASFINLGLTDNKRQMISVYQTTSGNVIIGA